MIPLGNTGRKSLWNQPVYADFLPEVNPFVAGDRFRPLGAAYDGNNTFWLKPSPEPRLDDAFWELLISQLDQDEIGAAASALAAAIGRWEPDSRRLAFAVILRAGVPIADWLCRLLPGSVAAAMSFFCGLGLDQVAFASFRKSYPERKIVFVDGWTGKGGLARELAELNLGPLAALIDPWGWADFAGCREDLFCPAACFTGPATLGFSRTFYRSEQSLFAAYLFPEKYCRATLVEAWQTLCPPSPSQSAPAGERFFTPTDLRVHRNEVCRALINAVPDTIFFANDKTHAQTHDAMLLALAEARRIKVTYNAGFLHDYKTRVACTLNRSINQNGHLAGFPPGPGRGSG